MKRIENLHELRNAIKECNFEIDYEDAINLEEFTNDINYYWSESVGSSKQKLIYITLENFDGVKMFVRNQP